MSDLDNKITVAKAQIEELEASYKTLIPLRRYYKSLLKIKDGEEPKTNVVKGNTNTTAVDAETGPLSQDQ